MKDVIKDVRAFVIEEEGGGDYHNQSDNHWIIGEISTPMSCYPEYKKDRRSWGINALGTIVVEIELSNETVGFGVSTGGYPAAWIIENHLKRFVINQSVKNIEKIWDQMFRASLYYGRKGLVMNAISAVDLALWDTLGRVRQEPVYEMIGGKIHNYIQFYATGPRPDLAKDMGFIGGKLPLKFGPSDGEEGLNKNINKIKELREKVGNDFWLMYDCYMSLDLPYAKKLMEALSKFNVKWIEESFIPDDYWSYAELKRNAPLNMMITTGEHEATRYGFRLLLEKACADIIQPDVSWCGGMTELLKISSLADAYEVPTIPHGSSVYSYHFVATRKNSPFAEFWMMDYDASSIVPMSSPLLINEPITDNGKIKLSDDPGFGVELNRELNMKRPNSKI